MTIEQLNEIVSTMDLATIESKLKENGFRSASKNGNWEFHPFEIAKAFKVEGTERYEDTFDDKKYHGDIHTQVAAYEGLTFIVISVEKIHRNLDNMSFPVEMLLFTDAPINEEYERKQSEICCCVECKGKFAKGDMIELNEKLFCIECFQKELNRATAGKPKHTKKIKDRRRK